MSESIFQSAIDILHKAVVSQGILASATAVDNYNRIWSRDSMMTGIAGILANDELVIKGFKNAILTLGAAQGPAGQIPSNVWFSNENTPPKVSYGGLAGRTDATTWWIIGACIYLSYSDDSDLKKYLAPKIEKAFEVLKAWEFNNRGFIYTPLGGNWADEYVVQGYTLYDQLLRLWALGASAQIFQNEEYQLQAILTKTLIKDNFNKNNTNANKQHYHPTAYNKTVSKPYWWSGFTPAGYDTRWDMAANAFALLLDIGTREEYDILNNFLIQLNTEFGHWLLPTFYPVITPESEDWALLKENYSYQFKNEPYHFHNSGSWIIFLGWLGLGLKRQNYENTLQKIATSVESALLSETPNPFTYYEYWNPKNQTPGGTPNLCFSASGTLFLQCALQNHNFEPIKKLLLL